MTNKETFLSICREDIKRDGIEELLKWLEGTDFFTAPASTRFHGNYEGGLCEHSLNVHRELTRLNDIYKLGYSKETIAVTALFHDLCKVNYYKRGTRNVKDENGNWVVKEIYEVDERVPLGHGEKSCIILQWYIKLSLEELLAIRWHMGGFDSATKGGDYSLSKAQDNSKLVTLISVVMRKLAHIEQIAWLRPIEGADKIELAGILGWQCIVKKNEFKVGDLAIDDIVSKIDQLEKKLSN